MPVFRNTLSVPSSYLPAYEDGTERVFRNVGIKNSDAGELPRRKDTTFRTWRKFEIKKNTFITLRECTIVPEHSVKAYGRVEAQFY